MKTSQRHADIGQVWAERLANVGHCREDFAAKVGHVGFGDGKLNDKLRNKRWVQRQKNLIQLLMKTGVALRTQRYCEIHVGKHL